MVEPSARLKFRSGVGAGFVSVMLRSCLPCARSEATMDGKILIIMEKCVKLSEKQKQKTIVCMKMNPVTRENDCLYEVERSKMTKRWPRKPERVDLTRSNRPHECGFARSCHGKTDLAFGIWQRAIKRQVDQIHFFFFKCLVSVSSNFGNFLMISLW